MAVAADPQQQPPVEIALDEAAEDGVQRDPFLVHHGVIAMFPDLDLTTLLNDYGHMTSEGLVGMIIDRMAHIPKKQHGVKRKAEDDDNNNNGDEDSVRSEYSSSNAEDPGDLLVDKMLSELLQSCKSESRNKRSALDSSEWAGAKAFILEQFPSVRVDFVNKMQRLFNGAIVPTAIGCFFAENNFGNKLQKIAPNLDQKFWCKTATPLYSPRDSKSKVIKHQFVPESIRDHFKQYNDLMERFQTEYPELLSGLKLTKQARSLPWERTQQEECIECLVCFDRFTMSRMICCSAPPMRKDAFFASTQAIDQSAASSSKRVHNQKDKDSDSDVEVIELSLWTQQTGSNTTSQQSRSSSFAGDESSPLLILDEDEDNKPPSHAFCRACVRGQAQAATDEIPLAEGGVGLKCMMPDCKNPILYSDFRILISREVRKKLDERIIEENIGLASLQNLERCKLCNFAIEMEVDKHVNKVFDCLNCGAKFCRLCDRRWDEDHFGITCEELDVKLKKDRKERELENKLNDAVIRKCPRCGLAFMKDIGCNKMTCRCGMKQCYLCRETGIDYGHFCQHMRDPDVKNWKCKHCSKKCLLFQDASKVDARVLDEIRKRQAREDAGEGTSQDADGAGPGPANPEPPRQEDPPEHRNAAERRHRVRFDLRIIPDEPAAEPNQPPLPDQNYGNEARMLYFPPLPPIPYFPQPQQQQQQEQRIQEIRQAAQRLQQQMQRHQQYQPQQQLVVEGVVLQQQQQQAQPARLIEYAPPPRFGFGNRDPLQQHQPVNPANQQLQQPNQAPPPIPRLMNMNWAQPQQQQPHQQQPYAQGGGQAVADGWNRGAAWAWPPPQPARPLQFQPPRPFRFRIPSPPPPFPPPPPLPQLQFPVLGAEEVDEVLGGDGGLVDQFFDNWMDNPQQQQQVAGQQQQQQPNQPGYNRGGANP